jgi:hypothetical protein
VTPRAARCSGAHAPACAQEPEAALAVLRGLTAVPRFEMATMLVSGAPKAALLADWAAAEAGAPADVAEALRALRPKFRVVAK